MIVKFLYTKGPNGHFPAVGYNTGKMDRNKGELMKVANFGPLQGLGQLRPEDYKNYLKMVSANNRAVKKPQLHVVISGAGKSYDKNELTDIAMQWLERMGYGKQPYLLIFHKDTQNNHIHVVSTRVDKQGKKIRDSYEKIRGQEQMNLVMGLDEKHNAAVDVKKALTYSFSTKAQFMMILESRGYTLKEENGKMAVIKFGHRQDEIDLQQLSFSVVKPERASQLEAIFKKYTALYDTALVQKTLPNRQNVKTYTSDFAAYLKEKHGLELLFHPSGDKPPYGYSVIDHSGKAVFKGSEIMPLKELLTVRATGKKPVEEKAWQEKDHDKDTKAYYAALLKAALYNYPDLAQGLRHQGLDLLFDGEAFFLADPQGDFYTNAAELLNEKQFSYMVRQFAQLSELPTEVEENQVTVNIANDVDDEAIHGRKRRRNKNR